MDAVILKLLCRMEREMSLQKLIDLGFDLLGNPMFYQDVSMNIPYYTQCVTIEQDFWQTHVVNGVLDAESIMPHLGQDEMLPIFLEKREPLVLEPNPYHNNDRINLAYPMITGNKFHGVLILASIFRDINEEDKLRFHLFAELFYTKLQHNLDLGVTGNSLSEQSLIRLLDGENINHAYLEKRMKKLNWKPYPYLHVATIFARETATNTDSLDDIIALLSVSNRSKLVRYRSCLVYIYSSEQERIDLISQEPALYQKLLEGNLCIAVSCPFTDLMDLKRHWWQTQRAHSIGLLLYPNQVIYYFEDLAFYNMLVTWEDHWPIEDLIDANLARIWAKDQQGAQLLPTLQMFLQCGKDTALTAERLFVHKNTVRYRVHLCEKILGYPLDQGEHAFQVQAGLQAIFYLQQSGRTDILLRLSNSPIHTIT